MGHKLNENGTSFQESLHCQSQENMFWIQEKGKRLIKIEDTHQEETMTTFMEDSMAQKILKALDEHGEALKKMGGRLTRLEESKLKKPFVDTTFCTPYDPVPRSPMMLEL